MSIALEYDLQAFDRPRAALQKLAAAGEDPKPMLKEIGASLVTSVDMRFENEQDPDGRKWEATSRGGAILQESGELRDSVTYQVETAQVRIGSNKKYARVHQLGAVIKPKNAKALAFMIGGVLVLAKKVTIPARPYLGINDADRAEMAAIADDYFNDSLGAGT